MPKRKGDATLSGLLDLVSEGEGKDSDQDMIHIPESAAENAAPAKKAKGRPKAVATRVAKPKKASQTTNHESTAVVSKPIGRKNTTSKRQALKEKANDQFPNDTEEGEEVKKHTNDKEERQKRKSVISIDELDASVTAVKQPRDGRKAPKGKAAKAMAEEVNETARDESLGVDHVVAGESKVRGKASSAGKKIAPTTQRVSVEPHHNEEVIPETQQSLMDVDHSNTSEVDGGGTEPKPQSPARTTSRKRLDSARSQPQMAKKQAGNTSDTERGGNDPATRRRLGDLTQKLETLDLKYRNLREVGIKEAEANFERLKKQSEERSKGRGISSISSI